MSTIQFHIYNVIANILPAHLGCSSFFLLQSVCLSRLSPFLSITWAVLTLVAEYVQKYATEEALREHEHVSSSSESSMSDFSEDEAQDMEL